MGQERFVGAQLLPSMYFCSRDGKMKLLFSGVDGDNNH